MVVNHSIEKIVKEQEAKDMENIEQTTAEQSANSVVDTQKSTDSIDYKAEYEKMKRLKDQYSKESADWKTKYNSTLSDVEKERIANEEREAHYREIERKYNLNELSLGLSESISDKDVVTTIASKMLDGDNKGAVDALNKYIKANNENLTKQIKEELLKDNPVPPAAQEKTSQKGLKYYLGSEKGMMELNELKTSNPAEYNRILKGIK